MSVLLVYTEDEPFEYYCNSCHQFRLSLDSKRTVCGKCGTEIKVRGKVGELDAVLLRGSIDLKGT